MIPLRAAVASPRPSLLAAALACAVATGCAASPAAPPNPAATAGLPTATLVISTRSGPVRLRVRVADTDEARSQGLMGVRRLDPGAGMAFLFPGPVQGRFWMKDTLIPLSIAFWERGGRVVATLEMTPCRTGSSCRLYGPAGAFVGAVEANRGFLSGHGVRPGDRVRLVRD
jgi:uncharacterized protein